MTEPRRCIEPDCDVLAGGRWSPYWCPEHDRERVERISRNLDEMVAALPVKEGEPSE